MLFSGVRNYNTIGIPKTQTYATKVFTMDFKNFAIFSRKRPQKSSCEWLVTVFFGRFLREQWLKHFLYWGNKNKYHNVLIRFETLGHLLQPIIQNDWYHTLLLYMGLSQTSCSKINKKQKCSLGICFKLPKLKMCLRKNTRFEH